MLRREILLAFFYGGVLMPVCELTADLLADSDSNQTKELNNADILFARGDYLQSRELYKKIRSSKTDMSRLKEWKYCTLQIVRCSRFVGDVAVAVEEYYQLCRVDSVVSLESIPIVWSVASSELIRGTKPSSQSAFNFLRQIATSNPNPAAELLASSVLSLEREHSLRNIGLHHLQSLANQSDNSTDDKSENDSTKKTIITQKNDNPKLIEIRKNVTILAGLLLWRERIPTLRNEKGLQPIIRYIEQLPQPLRAGPLFLYAKAAAQIGSLEDAAVTLMRIPSQYTEDKLLVIDALNETAKIMDKLNRHQQAENLRREIRVRN
ncbi:MAG: hypothetical protein LBQ66_04945 [Planctomycetaceae bacterium]|jgi:hypothetical protein|nr:hypothetical protein [Planctomycetaceae bacterium]